MARERERKRLFGVCVTALQSPRGCHCRIHPFAPSEIDLTRLHNTSAWGLQSLYLHGGGCVFVSMCLGALIFVLDYLFWNLCSGQGILKAERGVPV